MDHQPCVNQRLSFDDDHFALLMKRFATAEGLNLMGDVVLRPTSFNVTMRNEVLGFHRVIILMRGQG